MSTLPTDIDQSRNQDSKYQDIPTKNNDNIDTLGNLVDGTGEFTGLAEGKEH